MKNPKCILLGHLYHRIVPLTTSGCYYDPYDGKCARCGKEKLVVPDIGFGF